MSAARWILWLSAVLSPCCPAVGQSLLRHDAAYISIGNEVQIAIDKAYDFAMKRQDAEGFWGRGETRVFTTALLLLAWIDTERAPDAAVAEIKARGYAALRGVVERPPDGMKTSDLAAAYLALSRARGFHDEPLLRSAVGRLASRQIRDSSSPAAGGFSLTQPEKGSA